MPTHRLADRTDSTMCSCIPPPASLKPRKIYNFLVPDVFASSTVPDIAEPLSTSTKNKIGKLQEYVSKNPAKAGKVSRRLSRRIKKALYDHQLGYVRVAVEAYCSLLTASREEGSTFTFSYFNKELVHQPDALISTLLNYQRQEVQALGAELLTGYLQTQSPVEHQALLVAELVGKALRLLNSNGTNTSSSGTATGGGTGATGGTGSGGSTGDALRGSCLTVVSEYVSFCHRLKILPQLLEQIEVGLLDHLERDMAAGLEIKRAEAAAGSNSTAPASKAAGILRNFRPFLQDTSSVRRVVGALLQWLDKNQRWENTKLVQELVGSIHDACGGLTYPLTSSLLRHCASEPSLTPTQRSMVARLAVQQGAVYSLSAFNLALLELPRALVAAHRPGARTSAGTDGGAQELQELHTAAAEVCVALAREVGHAGQVCEAMATVLRGQLAPHRDVSAHAAATLTSTSGVHAAGGDYPGEALLKQFTLECGLAVAESLPRLPEQSRRLNRTLPSALLSALTVAVTPSTTNHHTPTSNGGASSPAASSGSPVVRSLAVRLLAALLPSLEGPLKDDRQVMQLLAIVAAAAAQAATTAATGGAAQLHPPELSASSHLVQAALQGSTRPQLLQAARTALYLGQQSAVALGLGQQAAAVTAAGDGKAAGGAGREGEVVALALAALAESVMQQVATVAQCTKLRVSQHPLPELSPLPDHTLTTTATSWGPGTEAAAQQAAPKLQAELTAWRTACMDSLILVERCPPSRVGPSPASAPGAAAARPHSPPAPTAQPPTATNRPTTSTDVASAPSSSGGSWMTRQISIRKDRLNIARVMDILGCETEEEEEEEAGEENQGAATQGRGVDVVDVALRSKPGVPLVPAGGGKTVDVTSLQDVLKLAAAEATAAEAGGKSCGISERQLLAQLQPLTC